MKVVISLGGHVTVIRASFRIDLIDVSMKTVKLMSLSNAYLVGEKKIHLSGSVYRYVMPQVLTETLTVSPHRRPSRHAFTLKLRLCARLTVSQLHLILKF